MDITTSIVAATAGVSGALLGVGGVVAAISRKWGSIERDVDALRAEVGSVKASVAKIQSEEHMQAIAAAKLEAKVDNLATMLHEVRESIRDIQRNCRSIAASGTCPGDPKNRGGQ